MNCQKFRQVLHCVMVRMNCNGFPRNGRKVPEVQLKINDVKYINSTYSPSLGFENNQERWANKWTVRCSFVHSDWLISKQINNTLFWVYTLTFTSEISQGRKIALFIRFILNFIFEVTNGPGIQLNYSVYLFTSCNGIHFGVHRFRFCKLADVELYLVASHICNFDVTAGNCSQLTSLLVINMPLKSSTCLSFCGTTLTTLCL